jgi:hypothetical protein
LTQAYLFDTLGYIKIEGVLSAQEVARLNGAFDHFEPTMQPSPNYADGALSPRIASPDGPDSPSRMDLAQNPLQWPQPYCEPVRECLCHPNVVPYLNLILGKGYRLDHGPSLFLHRKGFAGQTLHGGGTSRADFSEQYMFKAGRIYSGLIVCEFFLADEPLGAGGLAIVPGSHKSELPLPSSLSRMEKHAHVVAEIAARAGDVVIFTGIVTAINCKGHACGTQWCSTLPCIPCHIPNVALISPVWRMMRVWMRRDGHARSAHVDSGARPPRVGIQVLPWVFSLRSGIIRTEPHSGVPRVGC